MSNFWIVSNHKFHQHLTLESAETERDRLFAKAPEESFRVYRIKRSVRPSNAAQTIKDLSHHLQILLAAWRIHVPEGANSPIAMDCEALLERVSA